MKHFVIPPLDYLELSDRGTMGYFVLAHLYVQHESYRSFYQAKSKEGAFILLDNGAAENSIVDLDTLLSIVVELNPSEVIARDILFDKDATIKATLQTIVALNQFGYKGLVMGAPQGRTKEEWLECYDWMLESLGIDTIGLSKIAVPKAFLDKTGDEGIMEARHQCYDLLSKQGKLQKPIHFLGMGSPQEYKYYEGDSMIRSTDSCNSIWSAMNKISWQDGQFDRIKTPHDYFERKMNDEQYYLATQNISYLDEVMKSE